MLTQHALDQPEFREALIPFVIVILLCIGSWLP